MPISFSRFVGAILLALSTIAPAAQKLAAPKPQGPPALEIKGMRPDMSMDEFHSVYPSVECKNGFCEVDTTIAGHDAIFHATFVDSKLESVYLAKFAAANTADVVEGFKAKYGQPEVSERVVQNGYGNRFECPLYTWKMPDGVLWVADFRPDTRGVAQIEFKSKSLIEREAQQTKKAAGDV
jgi:hypothetical protein